MSRKSDYKRDARRRLRLLVKDARQAGCIYCGETNGSLLDFHHRNPQTKLKEVGIFVRSCQFEKTRQEIAKCDIVCAGCHRKIERGIKLVKIVDTIIRISKVVLSY